VPEVHHPSGARQARTAPQGQRRDEVEVMLEDRMEDDPIHRHEMVHGVGMLDQEPPAIDADAGQALEGEDRPVEATSEFGGLGLVQPDEQDRFHGHHSGQVNGR
jgi:hypothetical protein